MNAHVEAVLLAAGQGKRLGLPKAALQLKGRWMLPAVIGALRRGGAQRIHLVLSDAAASAMAELGEHGADVVHWNPEPERGRTSSLHCALEGMERKPLDGLLVHPCDIPLLSAECVALLLRAWSRLEAPPEMLARPISTGGRGGHPLLLGAKVLEEVWALGPDEPLRSVVHRDRSRRLDLRVQDPVGPFLDVDTPEQKAWLESFLDDPLGRDGGGGSGGN